MECGNPVVRIKTRLGTREGWVEQKTRENLDDNPGKKRRTGEVDGDRVDTMRARNDISTMSSLEPYRPRSASVALTRGSAEQRTKDSFLESHFGLVWSIAKKQTGRGHGVCEDLVQQGMVGLCKAYERFDDSRGIKFSSYATTWIRSEIQEARRNNRLIRYPKHVHDLADKVRSSCNHYLRVYGRDPTDAELARELGVSESKIFRYLAAETSMEELEENAYGSARSDSLSPEEVVLLTQLREVVHGVLDTVLSDREQEIIRSRFALNSRDKVKCADLALQFGVTSGRVAQIEKTALSKVRNHLRRGEFGDLLQLAMCM